MLGMILEIPDSPAGRFDGYTSKAQTEARVLRDVFRKGDRWYRTGDTFRYDEDGYFWFVDRIGDTFRWKSENVSTEEVGLVLADFPGPAMVNVFGVKVPNAEGRAGMVALTYGDPSQFDPQAFHDFASARLQHYAVPVFVRVVANPDLTPSFKLRKFELQAEGYDHRRLSDPLFVHDPKAGTYVPVTDASLEALGYAPFEAPKPGQAVS
jgi:fatty-acyl-CoA synthase